MRHFILLFFVLICVLSCTSATPSEVVSKHPIEREWKLVEFGNFAKQDLIEQKAEMTITKNESQELTYGAKMGCNRVVGSLTIKNNQINFKDGMRTKMYCARNMNLEEAFVLYIRKVQSYKVDGHFLTLTDKDGKSIKFIAADWD